MKSWLDKYKDVPQAQNGIEGTMGGLTDQGFDYNGAWGGTMQMGGSLPGSTGMMYARTQSPAPSNGKYAKKTKASAQNGIVTGVKDFYNNYLNSPKYKERLLHSGYSDPNYIINSRLKNIQKTKVKSGNESVYDTKSSTVFIHPDEAKLYNTTKSSILAHELSHAGGALMNETNFELNDFDINQINKRNKLSGYIDQYVQGKAPFNLEKMHGSKPNEFKADMDVLRYRLFNDKIYDAGKQNFNQDILNKAKQKYKGDKELERLFNRANDKDLIWLMNNIAQVNSQPNDNLPLAQNGEEMKYYQEGLDFKPKTISKDGGWLSKYDDGGVIEDDMGQWAHPGLVTKINSNQITMQGVDYPVLGISDTGDAQLMQPGQDYSYDGSSVTEYPMAQRGKSIKKFITGIGQAMSTAVTPTMGIANMLDPAVDLLASTLAPHETVAEREDLYKRYRPIQYPDPINITRGLLYPDEQGSPGKDAEGNLNVGEEAWRKALDLPTEEKYIVPSKYQPTTAKEKNKQYYTLKDVIDQDKLIAEAKKRGWKPGAKYQMESLAPFVKNKEYSLIKPFSDIDPLQNFQMSIDPKGEYVSIYDIYDLDFPGVNRIIKPYEFYDRFYPKKQQPSKKKENGGWLNKYE